jgi:hypothetical protein
MRWVLIILLMLNGIYYLWQQSLQPSADVVQASQRLALGESAKSLTLLRELELAVAISVTPPEVEAPSPVEKPAICWSIGPFKEGLTVKQVMGRMEALDIILGHQEVIMQGAPSYWVHIPPQASRDAAIKLHKALLAKKIDSFRIRDGELKDGISLGRFKDKARAEKLHKQRLGQGYKVEIKVVPKPYIELWAVFDTRKYGEFSDMLWDKVREGNKGLERHKNYCDKIASVENLE